MTDLINQDRLDFNALNREAEAFATFSEEFTLETIAAINSLIARINIDDRLKKYLTAAVYEPWFDSPVTEYLGSEVLRNEIEKLINWLIPKD